ncbi:hypothetical protein [Sulfitobacter dubius]|uniref:hypothetical protein n=1 Tax=Sulfitobacter dubius TaxID=218673 RepID=UPI002684A5A3
MKDAMRIERRIREINSELNLGRSYAGPDPDPIGTVRLEAERDALIWALSK